MNSGNTDLYVFDKQSEELLTILSNKDNEQCKYNSAISDEQLNKDYTLEFSIPHNHGDKKHVLEGNLIGFYDIDKDFQLFQIYKTEEAHTVNSIETVVYCEHAVYELIDDIVDEKRVINSTAQEALEKSLFNSRWIPGQVDELGLNTINFYYSNAMDNIKSTADKYEGELRYRLIIEGNKITSRLVDLLYRRGQDTGRRFEFNNDISQVKRTVDSTGIKTAIFGRGKGEEIEETGGYTRKINFKNVEWSKANGDPLDKLLGEESLKDPKSLELFGRDNGTRHRYGIFEMDTIDPKELLENTYQYLMEVSKPRVTYELSVIDLEHLSGYSHKKVRLGDTVFVIDKELDLKIEARVIQLKRDLNNPENAEVTLGNFIPDITNYNQKLIQIESTLNDRKGVWDKAFTEKTENLPDIAPPKLTLEVKPLFKSISLNWEYDPSNFIKEYELYASQIQGFTADSSNLIYRGKAGGYLFTANTDETWYFRLNSVNLYGTKSALSDEKEATTIRIQDVDFENLVIGNANISDVSADKLTAGVIDANEIEVVNLNADNINAGKLKGEYIEANSIETEHLKASTLNLINNPTYSGNLDGWNYEGQGTLSLSQSSLKNDTMAIFSTTNDNIKILSDFIPVDVLQAYKLKTAIYSVSTVGQRLIGFELFDKDKNPITPKHYNISDGTITDGEGVWDCYVYQKTGTSIFDWNYIDIEAYLLPPNVETVSKGINVNTGHHIVMPFDTRYIRLRMLNYYNNGTETSFWLWNPSLQRADLGKITFDQAEGGTLTLGGVGNEHGTLRIEDSTGTEVGTLTGDSGGFSSLKIDSLENTQNVVFRTSRIHPNFNGTRYGLILYVDKYRGMETTNPDGSFERPYASIQDAVNVVPKFLDHDVEIRIFPQTYLEDVEIRSFKGRGKLHLRSFIPKVQVVRVSQNGSNVNSGNQLIEVEVYNLSEGTSRKNLAREPGSFAVSGGLDTPFVRDGKKGVYDWEAITGPHVDINIGGTYDIPGVRVWRYFSDARMFKDTKVQVTETGSTWYTLYDSKIDGEYMETKNGYDSSKFRIIGSITIDTCDNVQINDGWIQLQPNQNNNPISIIRSWVYISDCIAFGNQKNFYTLYVKDASNVRVRYSEFNNSLTANIGAIYLSRIDLFNCKGGNSIWGIQSYSGSVIVGAGTAPLGETANTNTVYDGQIWSTFTHTKGEYESVPPTSKKQIKISKNSVNCGTYVGNELVNTEFAIQGYEVYKPNYKGAFFFEGNLSELASGNVLSIDSMRVQIRRSSSGGKTHSIPARIRTHNGEKRLGTPPIINESDEVVAYLMYGESAWVTLPPSMIARFKNGTAKGIAIHTTSLTDYEYIMLTPQCTVEAVCTVLE